MGGGVARGPGAQSREGRPAARRLLSDFRGLLRASHCLRSPARPTVALEWESGGVECEFPATAADALAQRAWEPGTGVVPKTGKAGEHGSAAGLSSSPGVSSTMDGDRPS